MALAVWLSSLTAALGAHEIDAAGSKGISDAEDVTRRLTTLNEATNVPFDGKIQLCLSSCLHRAKLAVNMLKNMSIPSQEHKVRSCYLHKITLFVILFCLFDLEIVLNPNLSILQIFTECFYGV